MVLGLGFRVKSLGFRIQGLGFGDEHLGFRGVGSGRGRFDEHALQYTLQHRVYGRSIHGLKFWV